MVEDLDDNHVKPLAATLAPNAALSGFTKMQERAGQDDPSATSIVPLTFWGALQSGVPVRCRSTTLPRSAPHGWPSTRGDMQRRPAPPVPRRL